MKKGVVLQQTPRFVIGEPPSIITKPPLIADDGVIELTFKVNTVGSSGFNGSAFSQEFKVAARITKAKVIDASVVFITGCF